MRSPREDRVRSLNEGEGGWSQKRGAPDSRSSLKSRVVCRWGIQDVTGVKWRWGSVGLKKMKSVMAQRGMWDMASSISKCVSNVVVKIIRESETLNCLGTCWRFHGLEDLLLAAHPGKEGMESRGCHKWLELETWVFGYWYSFNWLFKSYTHLELDCFPGTELEMGYL